MSHRVLGQQFAAVKERVLDVADGAATFGRMLTVGHVNYRDLVRRGTPEAEAAADRGYRAMGRG